MKYVKRPIPVTAVLWTGQVQLPDMPIGTIHDVYELLPDGAVGGFINTLEHTCLEIKSGEHYIVGPGAGGEFWPVRKDIFEATYEPVTGGTFVNPIAHAIEQLDAFSDTTNRVWPSLQALRDYLAASRPTKSAGDAYATGYSDGLGKYPSREQEFR